MRKPPNPPLHTIYDSPETAAWFAALEASQKGKQPRVSPEVLMRPAIRVVELEANGWTKRAAAIEQVMQEQKISEATVRKSLAFCKLTKK